MEKKNKSKLDFLKQHALPPALAVACGDGKKEQTLAFFFGFQRESATYKNKSNVWVVLEVSSPPDSG